MNLLWRSRNPPMQSSKSKEILGNAMLEIDEKGKKKKKRIGGAQVELEKHARILSNSKESRENSETLPSHPPPKNRDFVSSQNKPMNQFRHRDSSTGCNINRWRRSPNRNGENPKVSNVLEVFWRWYSTSPILCDVYWNQKLEWLAGIWNQPAIKHRWKWKYRIKSSKSSETKSQRKSLGLGGDSNHKPNRL